jgi:hypothetical protein
MRAIYMKVGLVVGMPLIVALCACNAPFQTAAAQRAVVAESDRLSREYLSGDANHARESLRKDANLLEAGTILEPSGRAQLLASAYFRLFALEERTGNPLAAKATLVKARYWRLRKAELSGVPPEDAVKEIEQLTTGEIIDEIDQLDKRHNNGIPAKYVQSLGGTEAPPGSNRENIPTKRQNGVTS